MAQPNFQNFFRKGGFSAREAHKRDIGRRRGIVINIPSLETVNSTVFHITYSLLGKGLRRTRETRNVCPILLSCPFTIGLAMSPHCFNDLNCFTYSFGSNSAWDKMGRMFSAIHLLVVISKSGSEAATEMLKALRHIGSLVESESTLIRRERGPIVFDLRHQAGHYRQR